MVFTKALNRTIMCRPMPENERYLGIFIVHGTPHIEEGETVDEVVGKLTPTIQHAKKMYGAREWNRDLRILTVSDELPRLETIKIVDSISPDGKHPLSNPDHSTESANSPTLSLGKENI